MVALRTTPLLGKNTKSALSDIAPVVPVDKVILACPANPTTVVPEAMFVPVTTMPVDIVPETLSISMTVAPLVIPLPLFTFAAGKPLAALKSTPIVKLLSSTLVTITPVLLTVVIPTISKIATWSLVAKP